MDRRAARRDCERSKNIWSVCQTQVEGYNLIDMDDPPADIWKEFERNVVSHSAAHHMVAIAELLESRGYARVSDVAKALNITRGSASLTLKTLKQRGLVEEDENRFLRLSKAGRSIARAVLGRKALIRRFFTNVLGVAEGVAEVDACKIEHLVGPQTMQRLEQYLKFLESQEPAVQSFRAAWRGFCASLEKEPDATARSPATGASARADV